MNERIKLLAEQAKEHANHLDSIGVDASMEDIFNQKFADMIVQECADFVEDKFDFCGDEIIIAEQVRKHFGVS